MDKAYLNWSSGKDSALALYYSRLQKEFMIEKLLTTVNIDVDRVTMHGVRNELLLKQAECLGLPLQIVELDAETSMEEYNSKMKSATDSMIQEGFTHSVFGDIFLEDLKAYREQQLDSVGLNAIFPLWKKDTSKLLRDFIDLGFKAIVVCTNSKYLDDSFCGKILDNDFIQNLPEDVDPCGENGEFHTFVFDGPIFNSPLKFEIGEKVRRSYKSASGNDDDCFQDDQKSWDTEFCFCDLMPED
ncbi:diphthine--ammonia ligase [Christiangramia sp. SM2212]|uniref:Diphthine--ammonia ligase n=1 Tax=Christiangramia sediminicola TaxID=3073267 RepID=A0ABU1EUE4_9FLAO|nr:diphthine--ammonia ligase [Christiangramia sp. SM2212]MDR5592017.1 diphthine--ammonia ligase [Christiangramia sp. SM2212]